MKLPRAVARFNRVVTNRVQGMWAPYLPPWVVVLHTGRRSGTAYRTPVLASVHGDQIVIGALYGRESDWIRNVLAAGSASIVRMGRTRRIDQVQVVAKSDAGGLALSTRCLLAIVDDVLLAHLE
jgi:deazaflavin-dependent oxidoreductase (nitroreductase family)